MNPPLLILGMHRSGTSCLAGGLECAGLYLGKVNTEAGFNKKGNRENESIRDLHDEVLASGNFQWDNPPLQPLDWNPEQRSKLKSLTADLSAQPRWGVKDPRTVFCLKGWHELFSPSYVVTFRHPVAVARSLETRARKWGQDMPETRGLELWCSYNRQILDATASAKTPFIRYDQPAAQYLQALEKLANTLGLDSQRVKEFHSPELRNQDASTEPVPAACQHVWDELIEREIHASSMSS
jgi:hypothetical protein